MSAWYVCLPSFASCWYSGSPMSFCMKSTACANCVEFFGCERAGYVVSMSVVSV